MYASSLEIPEWECIHLLQQHRVGRLCIVDGGYPIALPVNYRVDGDHVEGCSLVIRSAPNTLIGRAAGSCGLEVDEIDLDHRRAWSVIVRGTLGPIEGHLPRPDPQPLLGGRTRWIVVDVAAISGRRFVLTTNPDDYSVDWQTTD